MFLELEKLKKVVNNTTAKNNAYIEYFGRKSSPKKMKMFLEFIKENEIDISHWRTNMRGFKGTGGRKYSIEQVFKEGTTYSGMTIRRILLTNNLLENKCCVCGLLPEWNGKVLTLQIDHINGKKTDNRLENLRFLCPNCHTQTETWGTRNFKRKLPDDKILLELAKTKTFREIAQIYGVNPSHISRTISKYFKKE